MALTGPGSTLVASWKTTFGYNSLPRRKSKIMAAVRSARCASLELSPHLRRTALAIAWRIVTERPFRYCCLCTLAVMPSLAAAFLPSLLITFNSRRSLPRAPNSQRLRSRTACLVENIALLFENKCTCDLRTNGLVRQLHQLLTLTPVAK